MKSILAKTTLAAMVALAAPLAAMAAEKAPSAKAKPAAARNMEKWKAKSGDWKRQREEIKTVDFIGKTQKIIVARGGDYKDYQAHPTTAMLGDGKTLFCVWNIGHGGFASPVAKSEDGGLSWKRVDEVMPKCYSLFKNCPSIYRIKAPDGKERMFVLAQKTMTRKGAEITEQSENYSGFMPRVVSEDNGKTWRALPPLGTSDLTSPFMCVMTFASMVELKDGSTLGMFHRGNSKGQDRGLCVMQSTTKDGGLTWSTPKMVLSPEDIDGKAQPCEPFVFRSPDGSELCCILRENSRTNGTSLVMFSRDEGKTWSKPIDTPWALTGDRHCGIYLPDGRLLIVFRDQVPDRGLPEGWYFSAWIGSYDDIKNGKAGQYRVILSKTFKLKKPHGRMIFDGYYAGLHQLADGTIIATTYECLEGDKACSIVAHRFRLADIEAAAKAR